MLSTDERTGTNDDQPLFLLPLVELPPVALDVHLRSNGRRKNENRRNTATTNTTRGTTTNPTSPFLFFLAERYREKQKTTPPPPTPTLFFFSSSFFSTELQIHKTQGEERNRHTRPQTKPTQKNGKEGKKRI